VAAVTAPGGDLAAAAGALAPAARELLGRLGSRPWCEEFYLAGSAALALWRGHRRVRDLDLMAPANRLGPQERRDLLIDLLDLDPGLEVETARDGYLSVRSAAGAGVKLFYYPYPLADPLGELPAPVSGPAAPPAGGAVAVASPVDLGLMKLGAIISRGTRRDFVDLYLLCRDGLPLAALLDRAPDKFGHVRDFPLQALKGLAELPAGEGAGGPADEPLPPLDPAVGWDEVATWVRGEVRELGRRRVGLAAGATP
jgi:hypothetical protein